MYKRDETNQIQIIIVSILKVKGCHCENYKGFKMNNITQNVCDVPEVGAEVTIESELPLENVCDVPKIDAEVTIESELQLEKGAEAIPQDFIVPE